MERSCFSLPSSGAWREGREGREGRREGGRGVILHVLCEGREGGREGAIATYLDHLHGYQASIPGGAPEAA